MSWKQEWSSQAGNLSNAVQELCRMRDASITMKMMLQTMKYYCVDTHQLWSGDSNHSQELDQICTTMTDNGQSYLNLWWIQILETTSGVRVLWQAMQHSWKECRLIHIRVECKNCVTLVVEAEMMAAAVTCIQDMLLIRNVLIMSALGILQGDNSNNFAMQWQLGCGGSDKQSVSCWVDSSCGNKTQLHSRAEGARCTMCGVDARKGKTAVTCSQRILERQCSRSTQQPSAMTTLSIEAPLRRKCWKVSHCQQMVLTMGVVAIGWMMMWRGKGLDWWCSQGPVICANFMEMRLDIDVMDVDEPTDIWMMWWCRCH